ncbi:MAG: glutamine synthetase [Sphingomonas sp.]|nr:glutamine synthetase [Sphingomonas sp.]
MTGFVARHDLWTAEQTAAAKELPRRLAEGHVHSVRLGFPDLHGVLRGKTLMAASLPDALSQGMSITSSLLLKDTSHRTVVPVFSAGAGIDRADLQGAGDIILVPDPLSWKLLPWAPGTAWMLGDLYFADGTPYPWCPRRLAKRAVARLAGQGLSFMSGLEVEFHLTRLLDPRLMPDDAGQPGTPPDVALIHQGYAYLTEQRYDTIEPLLDVLRQTCVALDLPLTSMELEFGPSQVEFVFGVQAGIGSADAMLLFRNMAKQVARRHGHHASFMCRPALPDAMSSGWHLHQSLVETASGRNAFAQADGETGLSPLGRHYLAGLLDHAAAAMPLTTPTINGYKRYRANSLAPDRIAWGVDNRGAMLRVLAKGSASATRIENRVGEPAANPYLYLASQMVSGMAGIAASAEPPEPVDSPYEVPATHLPTSLEAALPALEASTVMREGLSDGFVDHFARIKRAEVARYNATVTDWEHREYFDLF